ncbi:MULTISPECIES: sodium:solute symporter [Burkholderiaceae]|uniref:sodium:solute symporter family protein n=1 Tax=Burkholderiaceae TaxID=119060 RepID=UPI000551F087|nr:MULTISPECIES: sodium:solute symporter [Burkholderiaceae]
MNLSVSVIVITILASVLLSAVARVGRQMNFEQWSVGNRRFGTLFVFLLMAGESFTTFTVLGASGFAYGHGGAVYYILAYECIAYTLSYWLLPLIWRYGTKHQLVSLPDFLRKKYDNRALSVLAAVVGIIALIPYIVLQLKGMGIIIGTASYGALSPTVGVLLGAVAIGLNVLLSGVHGSAWVSSVKDVLILCLVVFLGLFLPIHFYGSIPAMFSSLDSSRPGFLAISSSGFSAVWFSSTIILSALGFFMWPHVFAATFTSGGVAILRRNACLLPIYSLLLALVFLVGFTAVGVLPELKGSKADLSLFALSMQALPSWMIAVLGATGALCAIVPGSMLVLTTAILLSRNVLATAYPRFADDHSGRLAKALVPIIVVVSTVFALSGNQTVVALLLMGYNFVAQLAPSLFASLLRRNPGTARGAIAGIGVGTISVALMTFANAHLSTLLRQLPAGVRDVNVGIIALLLNVATFAAVSVAERRMKVSVKCCESADVVQNGLS